MGMPGGIHHGVPLESKVLYESNLDCYLNFWGWGEEVLFKTEVLSGELKKKIDNFQS